MLGLHLNHVGKRGRMRRDQWSSTVQDKSLVLQPILRPYVGDIMGCGLLCERGHLRLVCDVWQFFLKRRLPHASEKRCLSCLLQSRETLSQHQLTETPALAEVFRVLSVPDSLLLWPISPLQALSIVGQGKINLWNVVWAPMPAMIKFNINYRSVLFNHPIFELHVGEYLEKSVAESGAFSRNLIYIYSGRCWDTLD